MAENIDNETSAADTADAESAIAYSRRTNVLFILVVIAFLLTLHYAVEFFSFMVLGSDGWLLFDSKNFAMKRTAGEDL